MWSSSGWNHRFQSDGSEDTGRRLPEKWIMENTQVLIGLQKGICCRGANIFICTTYFYTANQLPKLKCSLEGQLRQINAAMVAASKEGRAGGKSLVVGDLTMTGERQRPSAVDFEEK